MPPFTLPGGFDAAAPASRHFSRAFSLQRKHAEIDGMESKPQEKTYAARTVRFASS